MYKDGYVRIGGNAEYIEPEISIQEADSLRTTVVNDLLIPL